MSVGHISNCDPVHNEGVTTATFTYPHNGGAGSRICGYVIGVLACPFQAPTHYRSASPCRNSGEILTSVIGTATPTADQRIVRVYVSVYLEHVTVQLRLP